MYNLVIISMNSRWYGIIALVIVAFLSIIYSVYMESRTKSKLIKNSNSENEFEELEEDYESFDNQEDHSYIFECNFASGTNCKYFSSSEGCNTIIPYKNPGSSSNVLRQCKSENKHTYYTIKIPLERDSVYSISCLYYSEDNNKLRHVVIFEGNTEYIIKTNKTKDIPNSKFSEYEAFFQTPPHSEKYINTYIRFGFNDTHLNKYNYITDIKIRKTLRINIPFQNFLTVYLNKKCYNNKTLIWKDESYNGNDFVFKNTDKKIAYGPSGLRIQNEYIVDPGPSRDYEVNKKFTLFMLIKKIRQNIAQLKPFKNNSNYIDLLNIPGNQNSSILLQIPKNYGKVRIKVDGKIYNTKYNFLSNQENTYIIKYDGKYISLYLNQVLILKFKSPVLYFNNENIKLQNRYVLDNFLMDINLFAYYNTDLSEDDIYNVINKLRKISFLDDPCHKKEDINKKNEKTKTFGEGSFLIKNLGDRHFYNQEEEEEELSKVKKPIVNNESNCPNIVLKNDNYYLLVSPENNLNYSGVKNYGPNREKAKKIYSMNFPNCPIPDILDENKYNPKLEMCPFIIHRDNPCNYYECRNIDWSKSNQKFSEKCKTRIDTYCNLYYNYDPACYCWRPCNRDKPKCKKWLSIFQQSDKCDISKQNIEKHPEIKKYVRKDRVPCWNCNLNTPSITQSMEEKRRVY